jgi:hypothetical protein
VQERERPGWWRETALVAALSAVVVIASLVFQPQIAVNAGQGWDGAVYYRMAEEVHSGGPVIAEAPFVYRVLVPLAAASLFPNDLMLGFKVVNALAIAITIVLMVVWLRLHLDSWLVRAVVIGLFLTQWTGPLRTYFWYPVLVDYWLLPAVLAGLLIVDRLRQGGRRVIWLPLLCLVSVFAVAVRESGLLIPLAALCTYNPICPMGGRLVNVPARLRDLLAIPRLLVLPVMAGAGVFGLLRLVLVSTSSYGFARATVGWLLRKWPNTYAQGWLIAYGPILVLPIFYWRASWQFLRTHQAEAAFLAALTVLSWIGGGDTERFVTWGAPIVYLLVGIGLQELAREHVPSLFVVLLVLAQAVSERLFWILPAAALEWEQVSELVLLTPVGNDVSVYNVTAWDAEPAVRITSQIEYALVTTALLALLFWMRHRQPRSVS